MAKTGPKLERGTDPVRARTYSVDDHTHRLLAIVVKGNRSRGLRMAVRHFYAWWARQPDQPK